MSLSKVYDWWIDTRWSDLAISAALISAYGWVVWRSGQYDVLSWLTVSDRRGLYSAFAVVVSLVGALSGVAVGQLSSAKGQRATVLKKKVGPALGKTWRSIYLGAMASALLAVLALTLDSTSPTVSPIATGIARWSFLVALSISLFKFLRLSALFEPVVAISVKDDSEEPEEEGEAPAFDLEAFRRTAAGRK